MTDDANRRFYLAHNLLENATTAIINVARAFSSEQNIRYFDEHTIKDHLCAIQNAMEGLLKVSLAWKDWRSVIIEPALLTQADFEAGKFKTITFDESVKLLKKPPFQVNLSRLKTRELYDLRMSRHQHTHYYLALSNDECLKLIAHGIEFCLGFYQDQIFRQFFEEHDAFNEVDVLLKKIDVYAEIRISSARKRYPNLLSPLTYYFDCCSNCDRTAPVINSADTVLCLYCGSEDDIIYVAENVGYFSYPKRSETKQCPECLYHSMGTIHQDGEPESWQCVICGYYTNKPGNLNGSPGGLYKKHIGKPERRLKLRWPPPATI